MTSWVSCRAENGYIFREGNTIAIRCYFCEQAATTTGFVAIIDKKNITFGFEPGTVTEAKGDFKDAVFEIGVSPPRAGSAAMPRTASRESAIA
jgi:hypothetical protein